uniref:Serine/threonine-protein kinase Nek4 n=1 Tax=Echeneis naucrates TaxID=173247 RepID=A0A665W9J0_ECHNA
MNNYIFIRVVGKGSYGEVNLVKHKCDRKQYVIKKLNLTTSSKRERRAAEQEAQLLSQLRHPNIVTYRESWEGEDRQLYIVMGFCEGGDLYHRLKQQKGELLPEKQVVEWFVQIAMALQYLHERNILHRDLKTQNIFLTKTNIIKVGDLGIARVLENQNDMASTLIGTPYYMSPELFSNKPYNHKSDVWALGCCVYEMSTLKHAFNAKDMNSLVYRIVEGKLPQMPSRYDPQLGDLIKSMLCKRPEVRPDVKLILRQPYIKRQIAMFLEATKDSPVQTPPSPKLSSPDALKCSLPSLATASNINIDIQLQDNEDSFKRKSRPQSDVFDVLITCTGNEHVTHSVHKDSKGKGKLDRSLSPSPVKVSHKSVSGVGSRRGDEKWAPNGLLDIQSQPTASPGDTFSVSGVRQTSGVDDKNDTMELLQEANIQNPMPEMEKVAAFSAPKRRSAHKSNIENVGIVVDANLDSRNDTITLLKGAPVQHLHSSDLQVSSKTNVKAECSDMHDLVDMMTQTLRMDTGDGVSELDKSRCGSTTLPEFKLNRKYRDTLMLHGKAREQAENLSLGEIPIVSTSGPAKIRRAIEHLRTDVVKGLGIKLLDRVLEIMDEDDDVKRELSLRKQMGDEKYQAYAVMVRQLKFFEDIALKV